MSSLHKELGGRSGKSECNNNFLVRQNDEVTVCRLWRSCANTSCCIHVVLPKSNSKFRSTYTTEAIKVHSVKCVRYISGDSDSKSRK